MTNEQELAARVAGGMIELIESGKLERNWSDTADMIELGYLPLEELHRTKDLKTQKIMKQVYKGLGMHFLPLNKPTYTVRDTLTTTECVNCWEMTDTRRPRCEHCGGHFELD
ncbi:hypothetical protein LCM10_04740 [Rossellomorea aquimaris]|uniref:hypothetical protein n=1 Tax=Rossellomorea aquimaris TaxID=189382 RepID=UPI001CD78287|nr:hypothetical protein [Rossellomorea aquimaris]MCA1054286.1 hypothetical protein [Rossellomorea aquimaris]